jgi:hypothetical protein
LNLLPPPGGVTLPNDGAITVQLQDFEPSEVGTGQVLVQYVFDNLASDNMSLSAGLSSLAPPDPERSLLIGDNQALRATVYINSGASSNPIMVSAAPVIPANAVRNSLRLNLLFQHAPLSTENDGSAELVAHWDPNRPPAFRLFFPYFNASSPLPAALDLTDSLRTSDNGYNAITSAWNIQSTFDPTNPTITEDGFWQVSQDPTAPVPVWLITPDPNNSHLFTAVESSASQPGPFLDLYLLSIVSGLPIDPRNPETILFLQWNNFPGYNDGLVSYPLQKTALSIGAFSGALVRTSRGHYVQLEWDTTGAYCKPSGDSIRHDPKALDKDMCLKRITVDQPLQSSYTLTAVGKDGVTQVTRRISVRWKVNTELSSTPVVGKNVRVSSDGKWLITGGTEKAAIQFFDPETLQPLPQNPVTLADRSAANAFAIDPYTEVVYFVTTTGKIHGYDPRTEKFIPDSGRALDPKGPPLYLMDISPDGSKLAVVTNKFSITVNEKLITIGANQLHILHSYNLQDLSGSPIALPDETSDFAVGAKTGRYYVALQFQLIVLDPASYSQISDHPPSLTGALLAISDDETSVYALSGKFTDKSISFVISRIDAATLAIKSQQSLGFGYFPLTKVLLGIPLAALTVSPDNALLFVVGLESQALVEEHFVSRLSVYDAQTFQELPWSPLQFGDFLPVDMVMSADGSRLFVLAGQNITSKDAVMGLYAADPQFV